MMKLKLLAILIISSFTLINQSYAQSNKTEININEGTGYFNFYGGNGHENDTIKVFYNKPKNFKKNSKILLVIPGAGRNADDYRDSWVETSERHNVLIISPSYTEKDYDYAAYHLGGLAKDLDLRKGVKFIKGTNKVELDENVVMFNLNTDSSQWIYHDFDRLFDLVTKEVGSLQETYDAFGHSAGGQILHRFALFAPNSKANRILASNAGSYTLPEFNTAFPFGVKDLSLNKKSLKRSFKKHLVIFLGELDNANETGGLLLRSPTVDKQGTHRLSRGKYFYKKSHEQAKAKRLKFDWDLQVISGVGHNQRKMAKAAAKYLYEGNN